MRSSRFSEEFRRNAVTQITERGLSRYPVDPTQGFELNGQQCVRSEFERKENDMLYKYLLPASLLLAACADMQGGTGQLTPAGAGGTVFNDEDRPDYRQGGDPVLQTGGGLNDEDQ